MGDLLRMNIAYGDDQIYEISLAPTDTLASLGRLLLAHLPDLDPKTIKVLYKGKVLRLNDAATTLNAAGVVNGAKLKLMASSKSSVQAVQGAKDVPGIASFEHEERRERLRQTPPVQSSDMGASRVIGRYEAWQHPGLSPPPSEAVKLLQKLASDPGILTVIRNHQWRVGVLSEMPPHGKVGVSPVCILGVNINKGQEISLRLRTDDLKGFRRYDRIRETFIHELAHMIYGDHDNDFKEFNSQLRREVEAADWKSSAGARTVSGRPTAAVAPTLVGSGYTDGIHGMMAATAASSGRTLRELSGTNGASATAAGSPRLSAAEAALQRARGGRGQGPDSHPVRVTPSPPRSPPSQQTIKKGDNVEYRQRDGTWTTAKVVAVDVSVMPPSYGIELSNEDGGTPHYRETEGDRLRPIERELTDGTIEGMGHYDAATEAKEARLRQLELP